MSKQEDWLNKYLGFDSKYLEDLDCLEENVKKIVDNNQSKDEKYKVLNVIKAEKKFLIEVNTNSNYVTLIIGVITSIIALLTLSSTNVTSVLSNRASNNIALNKYAVGVGVSIILTIFAIYILYIVITKNLNKISKKIRTLEYIELELERLCKDLDSEK